MPWRRLGEQWAVLFTIGVALWFLLASSGLTTHVHLPERHSAQPEAEEVTTTAAGSTHVASGPLDVQIKGFHVTPDSKSPGRMKVDATLEVRNGIKANVDFHPDELSIRRAGTTAAVTPTAPTPDRITVAKGVPQLVTVRFSVSPHPGARYDVVYQGEVIYSGSG